MQTRQKNSQKLSDYSSQQSPPSDTSEFSVSDSENSQKIRSKLLWSLKGLSFQIKELVNELRETTYKQLADILIHRLQEDLQCLQFGERKKEIQNLKRRVYDAINVMVALGVLKKERKKILFVDQQEIYSLDYPLQKLQNKQEIVKQKRIEFQQMTKLFRLNDKLIERNKLIGNTEQVKQLPLLGVSVQLEDNLLVMGHWKNQELLIKSKQPIDLYNEESILETIL